MELHNSGMIDQIAAALARAQGQFPDIPKDKTAEVTMKSGGKYTYSYADLAAIIKATRPALSANGLSVTQLMHEGVENRYLVTILAHASGQWYRSDTIIPSNLGPQELGSYLTYMRRYNYCGITGVAAEDDDDGTVAQGRASQANTSSKKPKDSPPPPNPLAKPTTPGEYVPVGGRFKGKRLDSVPVADLMKYVAEIRASGEKLKAGALEMVEAMQRHIDCEGMKEAKQELEPEWAQEGARIPAGGAS